MNKRNRRIVLLILVSSLLLAVSFVWNGRSHQNNIAIAVAKGKAVYDMTAMTQISLNQPQMQAIALADEGLMALLGGDEFGFLDAVVLGEGEAARWQAAGCGRQNCVHISLYDYTNGGTVNAVLNTSSGRIVDRWTNPDARPGGSEFILPRAIAIAAADPGVQNILGKLDQDPAMIPMSAWLADDACRDDWCVDLTYQDPSGSGKIVHVFVNMEQKRVARTFMTRGRDPIASAAPQPQRNSYTDGCQENEYGWNVCWEMTANDGLNFYGAAYNGTPIFASAKIGQIEAWYPSWPGGYRDEIGFRSTVPPFGDTQVTDLGDGFEVMQLFTEFTHWPNCICCYRYEQIMRFYEDGRFALGFVSHGPGCDDLSVYRPFWRLDLTLDGRGRTDVWAWDTSQWVELTEESEFFPFIDQVSPEGEQLATFNGDLHYRWQMTRTDPFGLDEARVFLLQYQEGEGDGPIPTGPGDTFIPPRQWLDGDALSGGDPVLWWVPLLKSKKSEPYWCSPDPEPGINMCETFLIARPAGELVQPTEEELAAMPTATAVPAEISTPAPTPTPRPVQGEDAEDIILNAGCGSCHQIGALGEAHKVGPDLSGIGLVAGSRVPGLSAEEYLRQAILEPNAHIVADCPNGPCIPNIMPRDYATRLSPAQLELVIAYLLTMRDEVVVVETIGDGVVPAPKAIPSAKNASGATTAPARATGLVVQVVLVVFVFLLTAFLLAKLPEER
ncbi:MAG: c-type cytochrome [Chloroflexi bacterium]|nr:c-type cytochrome [Chloroflexota bacterium]